MKHIQSPYTVGSPNYSDMLDIVQCIEENRREYLVSTFLHDSWERGRANLLFLPDLPGIVNLISTNVIAKSLLS